MKLSLLRKMKKFREKKQLLDDLKKFDYDHLEMLLNKAGDHVIDVTMVDGTHLTIRPSKDKTTSVYGRFEQ